MSLFYKVFYRFGITPWEQDPTHGLAAKQIFSDVTPGAFRLLTALRAKEAS
jgi:hypothetical protein